MPARVIRSEAGSDTASILRPFAERGLTPNTWSNGSNVRYSPHSHDYDKLLYCLQGSISFEIAGSSAPVELHAGDGVELTRGTTHAAVVGREGVTCAEAASYGEAASG